MREVLVTAEVICAVLAVVTEPKRVVNAPEGKADTVTVVLEGKLLTVTTLLPLESTATARTVPLSLPPYTLTKVGRLPPGVAAEASETLSRCTPPMEVLVRLLPDASWRRAVTVPLMAGSEPMVTVVFGVNFAKMWL